MTDCSAYRRKIHDAPAILETIAIAGLNHVAVVNLEGNHLRAALLIDQTVAIELGDVRRNAGERQLLVGEANLDVERVGPLQVVDQLARAGRPDDTVWRRAKSILSSGNGTRSILAGELFKMMSGVELVHVPYHSSYMRDLLGGPAQVALRQYPA